MLEVKNGSCQWDMSVKWLASPQAQLEMEASLLSSPPRSPEMQRRGWCSVTFGLVIFVNGPSLGWYRFVLGSLVLHVELSACTCWSKHAATKLHPQPVFEALPLAHSTLCSVELCLSMPLGASASEGVAITWKLGLTVWGSYCHLEASCNRAINLDEQRIIWILMNELFIWRPEAGRLVWQTLEDPVEPAPHDPLGW